MTSPSRPLPARQEAPETPLAASPALVDGEGATPLPRRRPRRSWTPERIRAFQELYDAGLAPHRICEEMNRLGYPVTRNAVIGHMHREGLASSIPHGSHGPRRSRPRTMAPPPPPPPPPPVQTGARLLTLLELEKHHCRYLMGRDLYCGADRVPGSPYCPRHKKETSR